MLGHHVPQKMIHGRQVFCPHFSLKRPSCSIQLREIFFPKRQHDGKNTRQHRENIKDCWGKKSMSHFTSVLERPGAYAFESDASDQNYAAVRVRWILGFILPRVCCQIVDAYGHLAPILDES